MADLLDETASEPLPAIQCPSCGQTLQGGTVICVTCGYNLRTRQKMSTVFQRPDDEEAAAAASIKKAAGAAGSYLLGVVLCSVAAIIGMVIWYVIAIATNHEFALIAWGVGILTGLGMRLGYRKEDDLGGITAAFICLLAIVGSKWLIFSTIIMPMVNEAVSVAQRAETAARQPMESPAAEAGPNKANGDAKDELTDDEDSDPEAGADAPRVKMDDRTAEFFADLSAMEVKSTSTLFFITMIGVWGIVFILLAFFTAYRVGSGGDIWW